METGIRITNKLYLVAISLMIVLALSQATFAGSVAIVKDGKPMATIVVAKDAPVRVADAAKILAFYIKQSSGVEMPVVTDDQLKVKDVLTIQIGKTSITGGYKLPAGLDGDGFVIRTKPNTIQIWGPTEWGTQFGVYDFLERYVGVRWLMPGSDGYDIPSTRTIKVTEGIIKDQPVFFSRLYSGSPAGCQLEWADFNRIHGRVQFHHNIFRLFPQSKYGKTHPEFYPMKDGRVRYIPASDSDDYTWEPCLSAPGSVEEAIKNIIAYFKEYPDETSFSLGMNDSYEFCRCPACLARISGDKNYLGFVDYSNMYYEWCNKVIEGVLKVYPDKWFGCLAYYNVSTPPTTVKLHPRLIPYITYDRMAWIDADAEAAGHANTEAWQKASPNLGWYDYIYGTPYCLPRVYFHESAKYLSYGAQHGVRAHYAELYPNWGEGPKPYIFAKLWWNPNRDVDALLKDWYEHCVGPDAAPYLAEYYAIWERFWTKDIQNSDWFIPSTFMNFSSASYLADVKQEDIQKSRELLETVIAKCRTEKQRARAQILEKAFQYYEASALAYQGDLPAPAAIVTEDQALKVLSDSETAMSMDQKRRHLVTDVYASDPVLKHPRGIDSFAGTNWGTSGIWKVVDWVAKGDTAVRQRVEGFASDSNPQNIRDEARLLLTIADNKATTVSSNTSFETGEGEQAADWYYWIRQDAQGGKFQGRMLRAEGISHTGNAGLLCDSIGRGGPVQDLANIEPGKYYVIAWVYGAPGQKSSGTVQVVLNSEDNGTQCLISSIEVKPSPGVWTPVVGAGTVPSNVGKARLVTVVDGLQKNGSKVYIDDMSLCRIP